MRFVVDCHVMRGGICGLHGVESVLLVQVHEHPALHCIPQPRALDLAWLKDQAMLITRTDPAVKEYHRPRVVLVWPAAGGTSKYVWYAA